MKILVTGSVGFIGYHLSKSLLDDGYKVMGIDNINDYYDQNLKYARLNMLKSYNNFQFCKLDISEMKPLKAAFINFQPQKVVNLAAQPGFRYSLINPSAYVSSNIVGFMNVIQLCKEINVENFIYASSSSVYGNNAKVPFSVKDRVDHQISFYGVTKRSNELIAHSYSHLYGLNTTGLRYFTVYGPWYRPDMAIFIFTKKIFSNETIDVFNDGKINRDFTFIDDIVSGTRSAIDKNYSCEIFNLGSNKSTQLMDVISLIEHELGIKAKIDFKKMHLGDLKTTCADIDYSKKRINYEPKIGIKTGISKFINWYKQYYN
tara:strand:- start:1349 stop:2299 length:951 start_codon:yes stop_codon:yes gene_type:complete